MNLSFRQSGEEIIYPTEVILASQSVGRKTLLEKLGIRFRVVVTHFDEEKIQDADPIKKLSRRSLAKADEIITHPRVYNLSENAKSLVIAADTEAVVGKKSFGKAQDKDDAKRILKELMGKSHTMVTALSMVLWEKGQVIKRWNKTEETKVTLRKMSSTEVDLYVARYDFTRFSAGYAITETPWDMITKIDGSLTNVVGLPFEVLLPVLKSQDIVVMPKTLI